MHLHTFPVTPYDLTYLLCTSIHVSNDISKDIFSYQFGLPIGWCSLEACFYPVLVLLNALVSYRDLWEAMVNSDCMISKVIHKQQLAIKFCT